MARGDLVRVLDALFQTYETEINDNENQTGPRTELRINDIDPNIDQPRGNTSIKNQLMNWESQFWNMELYSLSW